MSEKIILIDGHSILNRAFYGVPPLTSSEGLHTNAVYGFLNILFKILDEEAPQYLAVAFDLPAPTFRHLKYPSYKGTRHKQPDELHEQVGTMKEMLSAMRVPLMMLEGYEADDLIGTVSRQAEEAGLVVRIISGDRDLLQLASDTTMVRIPKTKKGGTEIENYLASDVKERYHVTPEEFVQVKALMGDASDNIPGIPGVGEKTATALIEKYHSIRNAHDHIDEIRPPRAQNSLREFWDDAVLSEWLATIDRNVPFTLDLKASLLDADHAALFTPDALEMVKKLELRTMIGRFSGNLCSAAETEEKSTEEVMLSDADENAFLAEANAANSVGICIDENVDGTAAGYAVSFQDKTGYITGCNKLLELIRTAKHVCAIDLKEQLRHMEAGDGFPESMQVKFFDCAIGAYLLNPLQGEYTYDMMSRAYAGRMIESREELFGKKKDSELTREERRKYACLKARAARECEEGITSRLRQEAMYELFENIEMPLVFVLYHMQKEGILVRAQELKDYGARLTEGIAALEKSIYEQAGECFNINSPKQLGLILFEKLHMPYGKKTKTGYSTSADVLDKLSEEYPIVRDILEYRQLTKLKSTYADGLAGYIGADGRIHGKFNQTITATGRISSTDPNLQNIPVRTELGRELRKVFVPKDGFIFTDADYSQIELRVLANVSEDKNLIEAYNSAEDIHAITASRVFHVPLEEVTPQLRRNAKAVNFGIVYGISSFGLSQGLSITRKEAQEFIAQYFRTFPGIKAFLDEAVQSAKKKGYSVTMFGRRRPIPELKDSNFMRRSFGERVAMNAPIQGTAADIIKIAMVGVDRRLRKEQMKSRLILQVHDELLVETAADEIDRVHQIMQEEMEGAASMKVRLEIDLKTGGSWYEAH